MSLLIVGSIAIDSIRTPWGKADRLLGGSASYAALAARLWAPVVLVGVVGTDFPAAYTKLFEKMGINGSGLIRSKGRTFRWRGRYDEDLRVTTLWLDLGAFDRFQPRLTAPLRKAKIAFLGNIHPDIQWQVFTQLESPRLTACDSREDWIRNERKGLLKVLKEMDLVFLNDSETRLLTGIPHLPQAARALTRLGPTAAIVKKGEHGVLVASGARLFSLPGYPVSRVVDPTGAGDAFAGAYLGYLATQRRINFSTLCKATLCASAAASLTIEAFGTARLMKATHAEIRRRVGAFRSLGRAVVV